MKKRLDLLLVERKMECSRERAKILIMAGNVFVNDQKADKPGDVYDENSNVELRGNHLKYVSRGGVKLEKAIFEFNLNFIDKVCMDIGSSTGGFTDCMLQNGARNVLAVDVGYGQLNWKLRNDKRVKVLEQTNARHLKKENLFGLDVNFVTVDVSFISLAKILSSVLPLVNKNCEYVCLIKPQFEVEKRDVGKNGVVKDKKLHMQVIKKILDFLIQCHLVVLQLTYSPIKGPKGNIEFLIYFKSTVLNDNLDLNFKERKINMFENEKNFDIMDEVVNSAHCKLNN